MRWLIVGKTLRERQCHICHAPYRGIEIVDRLETIPDKREYLFMRNPVLITFIYMYFLLIIIGNTPIGRRQTLMKNFLDEAEIAHAFSHITYAVLFLWTARTQNPARYAWFWLTRWFYVPLIHWALLALYSQTTIWKFGFLADWWLGAYWFAHVRILSEFNAELLH